MKLKIVSEGTVMGSRVVNAETGEILDGVTSVNWKHDAGDLPRAVITLIGMPVENCINVGEAVEVTKLGDPIRMFELRIEDGPHDETKG